MLQLEARPTRIICGNVMIFQILTNFHNFQPNLKIECKNTASPAHNGTQKIDMVISVTQSLLSYAYPPRTHCRDSDDTMLLLLASLWAGLAACLLHANFLNGIKNVNISQLIYKKPLHFGKFFQLVWSLIVIAINNAIAT